MTTAKPLRFGIVAGFAPSLTAWTAQARRIEELGLDTMFATDPVAGLDPLTLVPAAAAVTDRLTVGTFVLADPFRDARHLAWQADSLHQATGGRFLLGLGVGHPGAGKHAGTLGREFAKPGERIARLSDTLEVLAERPDRPRLMLAGSGPKMVELAARKADVVTFSWGPRTTEEQADSIVDTFRSFAGAREIETAVNLTAIGDQPSPQLARYAGVDVPQLVAEKAVTVLPENPEAAGETLLRWRQRWGISCVTVNSGYAEQLAAIARALPAQG
ncbi:LLM class flavin-dependent oxidoreductase [Amycolatopsis benzoatilytica]|uniref:LLM class flavin-dependent oxidoreductase n=1 Tax=Amycolatopsis benzoatilytica TaxID=346045 RepID=UPI00036D3413|nr:LLM class flavin-dependent oxidoreductase [Amycolatopsis benzoatilytica]